MNEAMDDLTAGTYSEYVEKAAEHDDPDEFSWGTDINVRCLHKTIYVAGPMTGLPDYNRPAFMAAEERLRAMGWHVENPARNPKPPTDYPGLAWTWYMRCGIKQVLRCGAIGLLDGWEDSAGAKLEVVVAARLGLRLYEVYANEPDDDLVLNALDGGSVRILDVTRTQAIEFYRGSVTP